MANEVTRKLTRSGDYSFYALLPPEWLKELGWRERQHLTLKKSGETIVLQADKTRKK